MAIIKNPFTPSFGKTPAVLAGRDTLIRDMDEALESGGNDPNSCSLFSGPRGVGKTVLLSYLAARAPELGWISANVTARPGMLEDIIERAAEAANEYVEKPDGMRLTSIGIPALFSATWEYRKPSTAGTARA